MNRTINRLKNKCKISKKVVIIKTIIINNLIKKVYFLKKVLKIIPIL